MWRSNNHADYRDNSNTLLYTSFDTLQFCSKDIITISIFTTGMVVKLHTLFTSLIVCPLLLKHITIWYIPRWIDRLLAWIYIGIIDSPSHYPEARQYISYYFLPLCMQVLVHSCSVENTS